MHWQIIVIGLGKSCHCGMKTYSEERIELRNLQFCWKSRVSFCHQISPVSWKAWMLPWILQELKNTLGEHSIWVLDGNVGKERQWRWKFLSSVVGDSQISMKRHLLAAMQLAVSCCELYFARCSAVNWTGSFASESKVMCLSDFKKWCFAFLNISVSTLFFCHWKKLNLLNESIS